MPARKKNSHKKTGATRNTQQSSSGFKRVVIVLLIVLFAAFLMYLDNIPVDDNGQAADINKKTSKNLIEKSPENKKEKYKFVFYTELPDREVETFEIEEEPVIKSSVTQKKAIVVEKPTLSVKPAVTQKPQSNMLYQLQVGAFADWPKADAMKGRLALLGVEPNIQVFHINGQKMYRVRIGPSTDAEKIERIKAQLKAQNINTFIQKIKS